MSEVVNIGNVATHLLDVLKESKTNNIRIF